MSRTTPDGRRPSALVRLLSGLGLGLAALLGALSFVGPRAEPAAAGPATAPPARGGGDAPRPRAGGGGEDRAPGDEQRDGSEPAIGHVGYAAGLGLAILLTAVSFGLVRFGLVWGPSIPIAISVLAIAQMGVHLVFFLHISSGPDSTNNVLALAFGVLIVFLLVAGSLWIMTHLNHGMMPMDQVMRMQR